MPVLITGAAGFVGRNLAAELLADGHDVIGVDNLVTSSLDHFDPLLHPAFEFVELDVTSPLFASLAAEREISAIYHLACPTGVPNLISLGQEMLDTCYVGSRNVIRLAATRQVPVLLASSAEVYGEPEQSPQEETYTGNVDPTGPRAAYEEGKRVAETLFWFAAESQGVDAKIARLFNTYGPGMHLADTRAVPAFMVAALSGEAIEVHGDGSQRRCHTYVADLVSGLRSLLELGVPGQPYNLGQAKSLSVLALAETIRDVTSSTSEIAHVGRPSHDHTSRLPSVSRAREDLKWQASTTLRDGLERTASDFAQRISSSRSMALTASV